jgi:hypothetical protein
MSDSEMGIKQHLKLPFKKVTVVGISVYFLPLDSA